MKVTDILKSEHEIILKKIEEALCFFDTSNWRDKKYWEVFLLFLQKFADDFHHAKEENIYFSWMLKLEPMLENGPLKCMLSDHEKSRSIVARAKINLQDESWEDFKGLIFEYGNLLQEHISKEDNILYNMAEGLNNDLGTGDQIMLPKFLEVNETLKESVLEFL